MPVMPGAARHLSLPLHLHPHLAHAKKSEVQKFPLDVSGFVLGMNKMNFTNKTTSGSKPTTHFHPFSPPTHRGWPKLRRMSLAKLWISLPTSWLLPIIPWHSGKTIFSQGFSENGWGFPSRLRPYFVEVLFFESHCTIFAFPACDWIHNGSCMNQLATQLGWKKPSTNWQNDMSILNLEASTTYKSMTISWLKHMFKSSGRNWSGGAGAPAGKVFLGIRC